MVLAEVYQQLTKETAREAQVPRVRLSAGALEVVLEATGMTKGLLRELPRPQRRLEPGDPGDDRRRA